MSAPYVTPQHKTERAFLGILAAAIASNVLSAHQSQEAREKADGSENTREFPCYAVRARDFEEYPAFTGNFRGNVEVIVMTNGDADPEVEDDDPKANHMEHVGLVGDALALSDLAAQLTTRGREEVTDFTCQLARQLGTTEQAAVDSHFETTHVFRVLISPSNV